MDLEVVGRHAMLFDDDAMASFVNSTAALVDWNSLSIDRYDVRHLLSGPPPPRKRRRPSPQTVGDTSESELDRERYLDLPPPSPSASDQQDGNNAEEPNGGVYNAVPFSYGKNDDSKELKDTEAESSFNPPFPVPESLLKKLPPTEKVHQIIAKTATFVSRHGGQSEIVLRVKHGDDPTFGFLMPDHPLHPYFRYLVDHQELLRCNSVEKESKADNVHDQASIVRGGGALSLLGTVYGSGEDEEGAMENATEFKRKESEETVVAINKTSIDGPEQKESFLNVNGKDGTVVKESAPLKEKPSRIKRNRSITTFKAGRTTGVKKETDASAAEKLRATLAASSKVELPVVEPPSDIKRVIDKIVEFIIKNGRQFESVLAEQDVKHGRFPFLLPSHIYHPYYLEVLQKAEKLKSTGKGFISEKHDSSSMDKKAASLRESDSASVGSDIPYDSDRKEKFKMVISKSKKDGQDAPSKAPPAQVGVTVDAAAAAAILQAATRGIKNPTLEFLSKTSLNGSSHPISEGGHAPSLGSLISSQPSSSDQKPGQKVEPSVSGPIANAIAKTAAIAAASEADSSEACLTKDQKVKAERLKRAKMFAAMIKAGAAPLKSEPLRGLSAEPLGSGFSGSGVEGGKERGGSLVPLDVDISDKTEKSGGDYNERRVKRKYRSRSSRHEEGSREEEEEEEEEEEKGSSDKHFVKKRRSRHSSNHSRDRHKHRRGHSSSKDRGSHRRHEHDRSSGDGLDQKSDYSDSEHHHSQHRRKSKRSKYGYEHDCSSDEYRHSRHHRKHDSSSKDEDRHARHHHEHDSSSEDQDRHSRHHHKHDSSSKNEDSHSRHRHKHDSSSEDEDRHSRRRHKHCRSSDEYIRRSKGSHSVGREGELEEGEIGAKSDQSKPSEGNGASREASVDVAKPESEKGRASSLPSETTSVSDDLRAKIRAMLMATL